MRHSTSVRRAILLACMVAAAGCADAADRVPPQSYPPEYFVPFQANTALDMISHLPAFVFDSGKGRGAGAPGNVVINGKRPASQTEALADVLARIPAAGVQRIEVIEAGGDIDMQGYATVANVLLNPMDLMAASASVASYLGADGSVHPALEGRYSLKHQDHSIDLALEWSSSPDASLGHGQRTTRYANDTPPADVVVDGAGISANQALKLNYTRELPDGQLRWNASVRPWTYRSRIRNEGMTDTLASNDNAGRTMEQGLSYSRALTHAATIDLRALYRTADAANVSATTTGGDTARSLSNSSNSGHVLTGLLTWQALDDVVVHGGLEHAVNTLENSNAYQSPASTEPAPATVTGAQESRTEAELAASWQVSQAMHAEAGMRMAYASVGSGGDAAEPNTASYPQPLLRLSLSPSPALQLRLRVERELGQLNLGDAAAYFALAEKAWGPGHADLAPAQIWLCEGAVEYRFWDKGTAALSYRQSRIDDAIDRMPIRSATALYDATGNVGTASADSVTGWLNVPTDSWSVPQGLLKLSTTWKSSAVTDPVTLASRRLSGEQPLAWRVEFAQDLPQQRAAWGFSVDNGWNNDNWQAAERDASSGSGWARAFLKYSPAPKMTVALELNNLAGRVVTYDRIHYAGDRMGGGVDFVERNVTRTQPFALVRVRRDW